MQERQTSIDDIKYSISHELEHLRGEYQRVIHSDEENTFFWFGMKFFVDQVRHLIALAEQIANRWERRNGKAFILNRPIPVVSIYVGEGRAFVVHDFLEILRAIVEGGEAPFMSETSFAHFLSLMVVEPHFNPLAEITTMLAVAHALAEGGRENDNIYRLIPPTVTTEVDTAAIPGFDLNEQAKRSADEIAQREIELVKTIKPDLLQEIDRLLVHHDRAEVIRILKDELREYVRTHLFARLARERDAHAPA